MECHKIMERVQLQHYYGILNALHKYSFESLTTRSNTLLTSSQFTFDEQIPSSRDRILSESFNVCKSDLILESLPSLSINEVNGMFISIEKAVPWNDVVITYFAFLIKFKNSNGPEEPMPFEWG